jgi:hypothetical protein
LLAKVRSADSATSAELDQEVASQEDLAGEADVSIPTIKRLEASDVVVGLRLPKRL